MSQVVSTRAQLTCVPPFTIHCARRVLFLMSYRFNGPSFLTREKTSFWRREYAEENASSANAKACFLETRGSVLRIFFGANERASTESSGGPLAELPFRWRRLRFATPRGRLCWFRVLRVLVFFRSFPLGVKRLIAKVSSGSMQGDSSTRGMKKEWRSASEQRANLYLRLLPSLEFKLWVS